MFLSNRDIWWAIECGKLTVSPRPEDMECGYDETSIDLHLGPIDLARVWNISGLRETKRKTGGRQDDDSYLEVHIGDFDWDEFAIENQIPVPDFDKGKVATSEQLVYRRGSEIVVKRFGFLLWTTKEKVGTPRVPPRLASGPKQHPELICFVNAKSTRARTGLLVHFTAPTIHAGWDGNITLEIANLGPFTFVLKEDDPLAQLTVATISSAPDHSLKKSRSQTQGQSDPSGTSSSST